MYILNCALFNIFEVTRDGASRYHVNQLHQLQTPISLPHSPTITPLPTHTIGPTTSLQFSSVMHTLPPTTTALVATDLHGSLPNPTLSSMHTTLIPFTMPLHLSGAVPGLTTPHLVPIHYNAQMSHGTQQLNSTLSISNSGGNIQRLNPVNQKPSDQPQQKF